MKLKFLSLFLALGIFAMGTSVMAALEEKKGEVAGANVGLPSIKDAAKSLLCSKVASTLTGQVVPQYLVDCCKTPCNADKPGWDGLGACVLTLKDFVDGPKGAQHKAAYPQVYKIMNTILSSLSGMTGACNAVCNTKVCDSDTLRPYCGAVCCQHNADRVQNCMSGKKTPPRDACANYTKETACPTPNVAAAEYKTTTW